MSSIQQSLQDQNKHLQQSVFFIKLQACKLYFRLSPSMRISGNFTCFIFFFHLISCGNTPLLHRWYISYPYQICAANNFSEYRNLISSVDFIVNVNGSFSNLHISNLSISSQYLYLLYLSALFNE